MEITRKQHTQDLSWFLDLSQAGRLNLDPPYQRRSVWGPKDRNDFLDTVFNNYPCPAIYLQKEITNDKIIYNVVDGKQRLKTIIDFFGNNTRLSKNFSDVSLAGKKWKDIMNNSDIKYRFYNYSFSVEQLDCNEEMQWDEVFNRVNKNQKALKDQELRHARFNGWFIAFAEEEANDEIWEKLRISTTGRSRRMQDVEYVSILMLIILENDFIGFPQEKIDALYVKYDFDKIQDLPEDISDSEEEEFATEAKDQKDVQITQSQIKDFSMKYKTTKEILGKLLTTNESLTKCITKKPLTHVYSLWALIVFNPDKFTNLEDISQKYLTLLKGCESLELATKSPDEPAEPAEAELSKHINDYYTNTKGAATEKQQRSNRHTALMQFLEWN